MVKAAAGNKKSNKEIITFLFNQKGGNILITKGVVKAVIRNRESNKKIITLLLD